MAERPSHEIRICLVLYGGVSLAIYMNGAAREFYDLVRGRGIWGLYKRLADTDAVVDVVSGASAGGINGLCLSYALCEGRDFSALAEVWRRRAGIDDLLQDPWERGPQSLLRSDHMHRVASEALSGMQVVEKNPRELLVSPTRELDCFMAVTDYPGQPVTYADGRERLIHMRAHRTPVHIRHRRDRRQPFRPYPAGEKPPEGTLSVEALAGLARATSAFPFAFEPQELGSQDFRAAIAAPAFLASAPEDKPVSSWFVDGGVLDNKPFSDALPMIYQRHADRPVDRALFFVEPHPDAEAETSGEKPNFLATSFASLTTLPSYQSIQDDLDFVDRQNQRLEALEAVYGPLGAGVEAGANARPEPPTPRQAEAYTRARVHSITALLERYLGERVEVVTWREDEADRRSRSQRIFDALSAALVDDDADAREALGIPGDDVTLDRIDIDRMRRAFYHWIYRLFAVLDGRGADGPELSEADRASLREVMRRLARGVDLLNIVESGIATWIARDVDASEETRKAGFVLPFAAVLARWVDGLRPVGQLRERIGSLAADRGVAVGERDLFLAEASKSWHAADAGGDPPAPDLLDRLAAQLAGILDQLPDSLRPQEALAAFDDTDAWRFPSVYLAQLGELDRVEYYRISPLDSRYVTGSLAALARWETDPMRKVAGRNLGHFAAFLKRSWRSNDILWGRLDAATILWSVLVGKRGLRQERDPKRVGDLLTDLERAAGEGGDTVLRRVLPRVEAFLKAPAAGAADPEAVKKEVEALQNELLTELQRGIIEEELPRVIQDALEEELALLRFKGSAKTLKAAPSEDPKDYFEAARRVLAGFRESCTDPLLRKLAARAAADLVKHASGKAGTDDAGTDDAEKDDAGLDSLTFFGREYDVGGESALDLSLHQSAERALRALRVVSNMLKHLLDDSDGAVGRGGRWVAGRLTAILTSLHVASVAVLRGFFVPVWLLAVGVALSVMLLEVFDPGPEGRDASRFYGPAVLLAGLFAAPRQWLGPSRWWLLRWPALAALAGLSFWVTTSPKIEQWLAAPHDDLRLFAGVLAAVGVLGALVAVTFQNLRLRRRVKALSRSMESPAATPGAP